MVEKSTPTLRVKPKMAQAMSPEQEALQLADEQLLKSIDAGDVAAVEGSDRSGADVNVADESQNSAVHKAARCDDLRVIKFLLSRGAHPAFLDNEGNQPAAVAIKFNNIGALNELLKVTGEDGQRVVDPLHVNPMTGNTLMHEAAWFGRDDCLKILLNTGAFTRDVLDQRNGKGMAPLHVASFRATKSFMQGLIEAGADASLETNNKQTLGESPLKIAMASGKPANAQFLQDLKAATNAIKFAVKMKAKRQKAKSANVLNLKFEGELRLFTADLEKSFLVKLARHVDVPVEHLYVVSRTAGSIILEVEVKSPAASRVLKQVASDPLESLSKSLEVTMLSKSVGAKATRRSNNA